MDNTSFMIEKIKQLETENNKLQAENKKLDGLLREACQVIKEKNNGFKQLIELGATDKDACTRLKARHDNIGYESDFLNKPEIKDILKGERDE